MTPHFPAERVRTMTDRAIILDEQRELKRNLGS